MHTSLRTVLRVAVVAVLAGLAPMLAPASSPRSPYLSALSDLADPPTYAKSTCNFKGCGGSRHNEACNPISVPGNCVTYHGFCIISNC
ncbi:MAG: hypothetical protein DMF51_16355 [Acidobacteria bacterium]|nr:MAG: hypothetical protein DMF51_16355 [Acidobacteriota bacterium]